MAYSDIDCIIVMRGRNTQGIIDDALAMVGRPVTVRVIAAKGDKLRQAGDILPQDALDNLDGTNRVLVVANGGRTNALMRVVYDLGRLAGEHSPAYDPYMPIPKMLGHTVVDLQPDGVEVLETEL